jgi:hypothetical protein
LTAAGQGSLHLGYGAAAHFVTENNDVKQHVYGLLDASLSLSRQRLTLRYGERTSPIPITQLFILVSMGHAFLQRESPSKQASRFRGGWILHLETYSLKTLYIMFNRFFIPCILVDAQCWFLWHVKKLIRTMVHNK